jgi:aromatic-L-amino-acid/L-tryptophan decarboxylase
MTAVPGFEWSAEDIRRAGYRAIDLLAEHLASLRAGPVFRPVPAELSAEAFASVPPEWGTTVEDVWDALSRRVIPFPFGNGHPRFFGWVNSPPAVISVLAGAIASAMNPSVAGGNHAAVYIEHEVLSWFKHMLGFPADAGGLLVSGGSTGALTALTVARHHACARRGWRIREVGFQDDQARARLLVYGTSQAHGCHQKAVELLGLGRDQLRTVPCGDDLRMDPDALDAMIASDVASGHVPMAVVASAGTVNTGVIDPLNIIADVCARHGVWLHIDGAYGAPAVLLGDYAPILAPVARADSIALDPHKWLYVPVDAGLVLIKDASVMRDTFSLVPPYLRTDGREHGVQGPPWFAEFGFEQSRPFRALKVWTALKYFGLAGYRALLRHDVACAKHLRERVKSAAGLELWRASDLSIVCFRAVPANQDRSEEVDAFNRRILADVQLGGRVFLSSTVLAEQFWLRACVVNPRSTLSDIDALIDEVLSAAQRLSGEP